MNNTQVNKPNCFMHQLTEALTAIDGWAQLSIMSLPQNEPERERLEHVRHVVEHMMGRVHGVMAMQRRSSEVD